MAIPKRDALSVIFHAEIVYAAKKIAWQEVRFPKGYEKLPLPVALEQDTPSF